MESATRQIPSAYTTVARAAFTVLAYLFPDNGRMFD